MGKRYVTPAEVCENFVGIGEKKALALLKKYKTKQAIREASVEELMETAKINRETAENLHLYIQEIF